MHFQTLLENNHLAYLNRNQEVKDINNEIKRKSKKNNFIFFDIENLVCSNQNCKVMDKNDLLIKDEDHWSYRGFIFFGKILAKNNFLNIILGNRS